MRIGCSSGDRPSRSARHDGSLYQIFNPVMKLISHAASRVSLWRRLGMLFALFLLTFGAASRGHAQSQQDEARAIFLLNFAKFVEWPATAFTDNTTPITIAVVDDSAVAKALERAVKGKNANGRDIVVKNLPSAEGCTESHIVYISKTKHIESVIQAISGKPILSVGEDEAFFKSGGAIRLFSKDSKVFCAINTKVPEAAGLKLGDKLVKASS
jgi:hypothetical protein